MDAATLPATDQAQMSQALTHSKVLATVYTMRQELAALWQRSQRIQGATGPRTGRLVRARRGERHHPIAGIQQAAALLRVTQKLCPGRNRLTA